ncbi:hypothetical protein BGZ72_005170 [Mortierella alpina]|nr:hypothetical protein BGZ72_005170 [Mortierella alpina]
MRIQWADLKTFDIIGSGSFGRVFHGDLLGTEVAIKECVRSDSKAFDEKYFKREVDILKQSRHPNIVQFMGICKRKKRFYIVTEFLPLGNLRRWIQDDTKEFGWDTRISFAIDISLALAYLHHKNIIHRDLKGENLLISENMRIKVCDFGFSRAEAKDDDEMRRISYCGTDGYMAPEILLGEDFDCSVDVFSFGVVLAEMMARHVVDPQHFQRQSPDMHVSPDEILFRAQQGCPLELGELAIHCVQPLPENRPKLQQIVERLTAIENVDIHVGTTLVVAPSVARAARNMMRRKQVAATQPYQHQNQQLQDLNYDGQAQSSSIQGQANTWRTAESRPASLQGAVVGSTSTYKGKRWKGAGGDGGSSVKISHGDDDQSVDTAINNNGQASRRDLSLDDEDDTTFRMPLWDSINSPQNQQQLQQWNDHSSVNMSTIKGNKYRQAWDQEPSTTGLIQEGADGELSQLSSLHLDLSDDGKDDGYSFGGSSGSSDEEDQDSIFDEDSDQENDLVLQGQQRAGMYELSSDSDSSLSSSSLTDSVVLALDTLEIPDLSMAKLPEQGQHQRSLDSVSPKEPGPLADTDDPGASQKNSEDKALLFRKPSLISRLLPPIPASENPWTMEGATTMESSEPALPASGATDPSKVNPDPNDATGEPAAATTILRDGEGSLPPAPPSKTSLLRRANTLMPSWKPDDANNLHDSTTEANDTRAASGDQQQQPVALTMQDPVSQPSCSSTADSAPTSAAPSSSSSTSASSPSSSVEAKNAEQDSDTKGTSVANRGFGLVRGMSDSFWGPSTNIGIDTPLVSVEGAEKEMPSETTLETGGTITSSLAAALGAKTWTAGAGGLGQWIGQYTHPEYSQDPQGNTRLKKHTSLKEGKQQRLMVGRGVVKLDVREEGEVLPNEMVSDKMESTEGGAEGAGGIATVVVKRRQKNKLTGISHRFSLVTSSALLLPKCDVCQKRLGVLPGWSSKHLECDDCGYRTHPKCVANVLKSCTSARKSGIWEIPV